MATVTKCDRCGQYVDRLPESLPFIVHKKNSDFNTAHHVDLCSECYKHFLEWVKPFEQAAETVTVDRETDDGK